MSVGLLPHLLSAPSNVHARSNPPSLPSLSEQDAVLEGAGDPVDDEAPVVAERCEEPGVGRRPLGRVDAVLVFLEGGHHAVLQGLLTPEAHAAQNTGRVSFGPGETDSSSQSYCEEHLAGKPLNHDAST